MNPADFEIGSHISKIIEAERFPIQLLQLGR
jgi:hypothetical protein